MDGLIVEIGNIRKENIDQKHCIFTEDLFKLVSEKKIQDVLRDSTTDVTELKETARATFQGARKIFAILTLLREPHLIRNFIALDNFERIVLDHKLPFSEDALKSLIPTCASKFYETQWNFLIPQLDRSVMPRILHDQTILPFAKNDEIGKGAFGIVNDCTLLDGRKVVRKVFSSIGSAEIEHRNLALLNHLNHPNIVELLNYYTLNGKHNFVFPLASYGDLAKLLSSNERPAELQSEESVLVALCGLSSALEKTHNFTSRTLNLNLIGCHHDLRPKNILVDRENLILADFGLSKFRGEDSTTYFDAGTGYYLAPECGNWRDLRRFKVGRPSDIWSLGCIITELLTHILDGKQGVEEYTRMRKTKTGKIITSCFHNGLDENDIPRSSESVELWLSSLEGRLSTSGKNLLSVARKMMALLPNDRLLATEVTRRLRYIALEAISQSTTSFFDRTTHQTSSLEFVIEYRRFMTWGWALQEMQKGDYEETAVSDANFDLVRKILVKVKDEIVNILSLLTNIKTRIFLSLQLCIDELMQYLPSKLEGLVRTQLELWMLGTDKTDTLSVTQETFDSSSPHHRIGLLAAMKHVSILVNNHTEIKRPDLELGNSVRSDSPRDSFSLGSVEKPDDVTKTRVLIEWKEYDTHWIGKTGDKLFMRVEALAELLNSARNMSGFRTLHCRGYFHDFSSKRIGFVYNLPAFGRPSVKPMTLAHILADKNVRTRPVLENRFKLAHRLCTAVLEFHKVGWLHKNLCARNIIFFDRRAVSKPYIIGFNYSRPNETSTFTEGPNESDYHHPDYLANRQRFRIEFDYYSLGLVLLEIGMWKPLSEMIDELQTSAAEWSDTKKTDKEKQQAIHSAIKDEWVSLLGQYMGTTYRNVVRACLAGDFGASSGGSDVARIEMFPGVNFKRLIVEPLATCRV